MSYRPNGNGPVEGTIGADLAAYDMLPPAVRKALREARVPISAVSVKAALVMHGRDRETIGRVLRAIDGLEARVLGELAERDRQEMERAATSPHPASPSRGEGCPS